VNQRERYAPGRMGPAMSGQTPATVEHRAAFAVHARALIDSYGLKIAHDIARTNVEFDAGNDYWRRVLFALSTVEIAL
jgi:hypothetical protein